MKLIHMSFILLMVLLTVSACQRKAKEFKSPCGWFSTSEGDCVKRFPVGNKLF